MGTMSGLDRRWTAAVLTCALIVLGLAVPRSARADTRTYPGPAPCNTTLQACINGATAGDTIELATNSAIDENLTISKSLTLRGATGFDPVIGGSTTTRTVILKDGGSSSLGMLIHLEGLKLDNAGVDVQFVAGTGHTAIVENSSIEAPAGNGVDVSLSVGSAVFIRNNAIHANSNPLEASMAPAVADVATLVVESNRISSPDPVNAHSGIEVDLNGSSTTKVRIFSNVVHRTSGCDCGGATAISVETSDSVDAHADVTGNTIDQIRHNTTGLEIEGSPSSSLSANVFNNTITRIKGAPVEFEGGATVRNGYNNFFDNRDPARFGGNPRGPSTLNVDPRYRDPDSSDYRLRARSPLINRGLTCTPGGFSRRDAASNSRLNQGRVDIGAFERGAGPVIGGTVYVGTGAIDNYVAADGNDIFCGMGGPDTFSGNNGNDVAFGGKGADELVGGFGHDVLVGDKGGDEVYGQEGPDLLQVKDGVEGNDKASGGPDADTCRADRGDRRVSC